MSSSVSAARTLPPPITLFLLETRDKKREVPRGGDAKRGVHFDTANDKRIVIRMSQRCCRCGKLVATILQLPRNASGRETTISWKYPHERIQLDAERIIHRILSLPYRDIVPGSERIARCTAETDKSLSCGCFAVIVVGYHVGTFRPSLYLEHEIPSSGRRDQSVRNAVPEYSDTQYRAYVYGHIYVD